MFDHTQNAIPCGAYKGRRFYRIPVAVSLNNSRALSSRVVRFEVIAPSAADAANWARDQFATRAETEVYAKGPKGGIVKRYVGWESAIGAAMFDSRARVVQLPLFADKE